MKSPLFYIAVGVGGVWLFHHFVKPIPGAKSGG
jgi:uncharacterized membrane protein YuzA (DUF378 family)